MPNFLKKALALLLGLLLVFVILEIFLRIIGFVNISEASSAGNESDENGKNTILCIGASFTRGIAASAGKDYPSRLQEMLDTLTNKKYKVVNTAVAGRNSTQILNELESELNAVKPYLAILLLGGANNWNHWGYNTSLKEGYRSIWDEFSSNIRVFRLIKLLSGSFVEKLESEKEQYLEQERFEQTLKEFNEAIKQNPNDANAYYDVGAFYMWERDIDKAIEWFKKGIKADPRELKNYLGLGAASHELALSDDELKWFEKGLEANTYSGRDKLYALVVNHYVKNKKYDYAIGLLKEAIKSFPLCGDFYSFLLKIQRDYTGERAAEISELLSGSPPAESLEYLHLGDMTFSFPPNVNEQLSKNSQLIASWLRSDLEKIIDICRLREIKMIILNYPLRGHFWNQYSMSYKQANDVIEAVAKDCSIPFVDNKKIFDKLGDKKTDYLEERGSADHCNEKGYELIAHNVFNKIIQLESKKPDEIRDDDIIDENDSDKIDSIAVRSGVYIEKGAQKSESGDFKGAINDFNKALEINPESVDAYRSRGYVYMNISKYKAALADYNKAIELDPADIESYNNRGYLKNMLGNYKGAIEDYNKIIQAHRNHPFAYNNRGFAKLKLKNYKGALKDINKSIELLNTNSYAFKNRAMVYIAMNKRSKACKDLQKALDLGFSVDYGSEVRDLMKKYCK